MASRSELYVSDTHNDDGAENTNVTGETSDTRRGMHTADLPITSAKEVTPASDTDVAFDHRYVYAEGAGDVTVRFESGGTAYAIAFPDNGILPMRVYSIDAYGGTGSVWLFG